MNYTDIFTFDSNKIGFSGVVNNSSNGINYQKVYLNYEGSKFHFELPPVEMTITKNTKKTYDAYSAKIRLNICPKQQELINVYNCVRNKCVEFVEQNKSKLDFKNKSKFNSKNCDNFANPLFYFTDKETGEIRSDTLPMIYSNLIVNGKDNSRFLYPIDQTRTETIGHLQLLETKLHCIPILTFSNIYISADGDIRLQTYVKQTLIYNVVKEQQYDQQQSLSKYDIELLALDI